MRRTQASREEWAKIRREYVTRPGVTCKSLAEAYGLTTRSVAIRCAKEKWRSVGRMSACRKELAISKELLSLPTEPAALAKLLREQTVQEGAKWIARIEAAWKQETKIDGVTALKSLIPLWRQVRGMMEEAAASKGTQAAPLSVSVNVLSGGFRPRPVHDIGAAEPA